MPRYAALLYAYAAIDPRPIILPAHASARAMPGAAFAQTHPMLMIRALHARFFARADAFSFALLLRKH